MALKTLCDLASTSSLSSSYHLVPLFLCLENAKYFPMLGSLH